MVILLLIEIAVQSKNIQGLQRKVKMYHPDANYVDELQEKDDSGF